MTSLSDGRAGNTVQIVSLTEDHVVWAAQALAEAFSTEPLKGFFLSRQFPRRVFAWILRKLLTSGKHTYVALAGGEVVGAVVAAPPPRWRRGGSGHWKIVLLGVRPPWRGRGVGRALMERAHGLCEGDPRARGMYLSTHGRRNRSFYERLGYKVIARVRLGRLELYRMVRPRA